MVHVEAGSFRSRARGDHRTESDADLAVVLDGEPGRRAWVAGEMARIAFDVLLETRILIDPMPFWADELDRPEAFSNPRLVEAILRDGIRL
ncbi:MAG: nucleotidyltransferase domain-containing protein [Reyranellaceae bacterium]